MVRTILVLVVTASVIRAAPAPKNDVPRPTVATLRAALGKTHLGKEVRPVGRQLGEDPVVRYDLWSPLAPETDREDDGFYLIWKGKGIDMRFEQGRLTAAFLYAEGMEGHKRYRGELPDGLSFDDDLAAVEKKLGQPTDRIEFPARRINGQGPEVEEVSLLYPRKGLLVHLLRPVGGRASVRHIAIQAPKEE